MEKFLYQMLLLEPFNNREVHRFYKWCLKNNKMFDFNKHTKLSFNQTKKMTYVEYLGGHNQFEIEENKRKK